MGKKKNAPPPPPPQPVKAVRKEVPTITDDDKMPSGNEVADDDTPNMGSAEVADDDTPNMGSAEVADDTNDQGFNPDKDVDVAKAPFEVAQGKCLVCKRGSLEGGQAVDADDLGGGARSLAHLVRIGVVVEN